MIGRFSPRPGSSSAAQYAIASIGIKIDDYSGRGFGVKGRPYLPPVNSFYGVANPALGYALGAANSLIKSLANISSPSPSSNPQEDTYAANDSGANLASSESDEETLTDLERLVKEQDKYKKAADAKKKELEAKKKDLPQEDDPAASIEIENINEQIEKIEEEQKAYNKKVNETLEKATESINANKKEGE
ncbi:MAG: hypothetical protein O3C63_02655, partial [Cyanobacteria bacterium]|nr:hypothetical protein [Cyanobacteriota bacterium]